MASLPRRPFGSTGHDSSRVIFGGAALMVDKKYHTLPVTDRGELVGVVGKEDVLRTIVIAPRRHREIAGG